MVAAFLRWGRLPIHKKKWSNDMTGIITRKLIYIGKKAHACHKLLISKKAVYKAKLELEVSHHQQVSSNFMCKRFVVQDSWFQVRLCMHVKMYVHCMQHVFASTYIQNCTLLSVFYNLSKHWSLQLMEPLDLIFCKLDYSLLSVVAPNCKQKDSFDFLKHSGFDDNANI